MNWKERKQVAQDLKSVYRAATAEEAEREIGEFAARWNGKYPTIAAIWQRNWERVIPFFAFPAEIRKIIYTTNAVESLNMTLRKALKTRGAFPSEEAAFKVMYLALRNVIEEMGTAAEMEGGAEPVHHAMGRSDSSSGASMNPLPLRPADFQCGRLRPPSRLTMNSLRSALTAAFAGLKIHKSGRSGTTKELARRRAITRGTTITQNPGHYLKHSSRSLP